MEVARSRYDYVIIDTPPIGLVIDAVIIAHQADASLLVTAAGKIKRRFVAKAVEQLEQSGSQFLGFLRIIWRVRKKIRPKRRSFKSTSS